MRDIGERAAVDERRIVLQRLHEVRLQGVLAGAPPSRPVTPRSAAVTGSPARVRATMIRPSRAPRSSRSRARQNTAITSEATVMSNPSSRGKPLATPPRDDTTSRSARSFMSSARRQAIAARVDVERVAPVDVVVEHRGEQVVGARDGVEIAGEMQVDLLHRRDLRPAAAGRPALLAEARAERGLAQAHDRRACRCGSARRRGRPSSWSCPRRPASG